MNAYQILGIVLSVIEFLLIIPGLWVAGTLLPKAIGWIRVEPLHEQLSRTPVRLVVWMALGMLFTGPLLDLVNILGSLPVFFTPSNGSFATVFGTVPSNSLAQFQIVIMVLVYLLVWWVARRYLTAPEPLSGVEWAFVVLAVASLVDSFISRGVLGFLQLPIPSTVGFLGSLGASGFILAAVVGLVLLAVIVVGVNLAMANHPLEDERE